MNQAEEEFLKEMADWEQEPQPLSDDEMLRLHTRVLEKAGLKKKKARPALRVYKWAAFAAVMAFALLGAGATYFKVSDLFRPQLAAEAVDQSPLFSGQGDGGLRSTAEAGDAASYCMPQEAYNETVADMGSLLNAAPETAAGVTMKAEGLVGDADTLMLMLSAEDAAGTLSGNLQLGEVWLSSASGDGTRYEQRLCDIEAVSSADGSSARFFVKDKLSQNILGQTVVLTVRDVTRFENSRGEALALCEDDLYAFWQKLGDEGRGQFVTDGDQPVLQDGTGALPLTQDDGALQLCAMGIQDGVFYFNVRAEGTDGPPVENLVLKNKTTGALLTGFTAVTGSRESYLYRFEIPGIESAEELKNYTLVKNGGWCSVKVAEGVWSFEITPEYQDLSETVLLDQDIGTAQGRMHFDTLKVSPISVSFTGSASFEPDFVSLASQPSLRMADGAAVKLDSMQASYASEDGAFTLEFILPRMIEPEKLAAVEMDGLSIDLKAFLAPDTNK